MLSSWICMKYMPWDVKHKSINQSGFLFKMERLTQNPINCCLAGRLEAGHPKNISAKLRFNQSNNFRREVTCFTLYTYLAHCRCIWISSHFILGFVYRQLCFDLVAMMNFISHQNLVRTICLTFFLVWLNAICSVVSENKKKTWSFHSQHWFQC